MIKEVLQCGTNFTPLRFSSVIFLETTGGESRITAWDLIIQGDFRENSSTLSYHSRAFSYQHGILAIVSGT